MDSPNSDQKDRLLYTKIAGRLVAERCSKILSKISKEEIFELWRETLALFYAEIGCPQDTVDGIRKLEKGLLARGVEKSFYDLETFTMLVEGIYEEAS